MKYQYSKGRNQSGSFRSDKTQDKVPAKIINFSFIGGPKPRINKPPK